MKSIMLTVKPDQVCKILNGEQTAIIKKRFPKDYQGWVEIYCTKEDKNGWLYYDNNLNKYNFTYNGFVANNVKVLNSKVVARVYCDKTENLMNYFNSFKDNHFYDLLKGACWNEYDIQKYLGNHTKSAYAINISKVEVFDKPKELEEFNKYGYKKAMDELLKETLNAIDKGEPHSISNYQVAKKHTITTAPQNYCYIEL